MAEDKNSLIRAGDRYRDKRNWTGAREAYARALQLDPAMDHIWIQYGHALKESGDRPAAEIAYRKALGLAPAVADTHLQLGHLLKLMGRMDEAAAAYCEALRLDPSLEDARNEVKQLALHPVRGRPVQKLAFELGLDLSKQLRCVIIGTTGLCNASCIHCPTGKLETNHVPRIPMPMPLFEKILSSLAAGGYTVAVQISFGLFGDALADPFVLERARLVRRYLPDVRLSINTNGAAYNRARHRELANYTSIIALHVESLIPATYEKLMHPLRFDRVFPKFEQLLEDFPGQVAVSVPASRLNLNELPAIQSYFMDRGAAYVNFDRLSNRCREDRELFDSIALGTPQPTRCNSGALRDLIIDCDGKVLVCCNDFRRLEPVGDIAEAGLRDVLANARRTEIAKKLEAGAWAEIATCRNCYADGPVNIKGIMGKPQKTAETSLF